MQEKQIQTKFSLYTQFGWKAYAMFFVSGLGIPMTTLLSKFNNQTFRKIWDAKSFIQIDIKTRLTRHSATLCW